MKELFRGPVIWSYTGATFAITALGNAVILIVTPVFLAQRLAADSSEWPELTLALIGAFWSNQLTLLSGIAICWTAIFVLNVAEPLYHALGYKRRIVQRRDVVHLRRLKLLSRLSAICFLIACICFIPIVNSRGIGWLGGVLQIFGLLAFLLGVATHLGIRVPGFADYVSLIKYDFPLCSFDVASTAPISQDVARAVADKPNVDISRLLTILAQLLGVQADLIRLHSNTTSAYDHALREMFENGFTVSRPIILASDAEYPKIDEILVDHSSRTNREVTLARAEILSLLWEGASDQRIVDAYARKAGESQIPLQILSLCHVHHATGRDLPVLAIIDKLTDNGALSPESYVLIDGAQSVGNIEIPKGMWDRCDFYAFCGHKWLLGKPDLGCLITRRFPGGRSTWKDIPLPAGLSRDRDPNERYGSTANPESRISLQVAITPMLSIGLERVAKWNGALANLFREQLQFAELPIYPIGAPQGGIVTARGEEPIVRLIAAHVQSLYGRITTYDRSIIPSDPNSAIRFCFHCFHTRDDIYGLIEHLAELQVPE